MTLFFSVSVFSEKKAEKTGKKSFWEKYMISENITYSSIIQQDPLYLKGLIRNKPHKFCECSPMWTEFICPWAKAMLRLVMLKR